MDRNILLAAIEACSDGILISDERGNVIYTNNAYEIITGLRKEEIVGKNLRTLLDEEIINKAISLSVIQDEKPKSTIHKYVTGKSALSTASPIFDENHKLIGVVNNTRNITELINLKNELAQTKELSVKYSQELRRLRQLTFELDDFICESRKMEETIKLRDLTLVDIIKR